MSIWTILYYSVSIALWLGLTVLGVRAWQPGFPAWLEDHPRLRLALLGVSQLPPGAERTLRRFYTFFAGGWTWILLWSWWLMPALKNFFFRSIPTAQAYQVARISTLVVVATYAAVGFYALGRAIAIWYKDIYSAAGNDKPV